MLYNDFRQRTIVTVLARGRGPTRHCIVRHLMPRAILGIQIRQSGLV
jgi:hypothetical protein